DLTDRRLARHHVVIRSESEISEGDWIFAHLSGLTVGGRVIALAARVIALVAIIRRTAGNEERYSRQDGQAGCQPFLVAHSETPFSFSRCVSTFSVEEKENNCYIANLRL